MGTPVVARLTLLIALTIGLNACAPSNVLTLPPPLWTPPGSARARTSTLRPPSKDAAEAPVFAGEAGALRIDQLQFKGSHNSYHRAPRFSLSPRFRYDHAPLATQLEQQGVRHLEIDVRYADGRLRVGHAPIIDGETSCSDFNSCIRQVKEWSQKHAGHLPVFVFVQPKEGGLIGADLDGRLELLDHEISRVFARRELLTPREVARGYPSLVGAVRELGWPTLENTRGKVAFVLFGAQRLVRKYARGRPALAGRLMFAAANHAGAEYAAILSIDDPVSHQSAITSAVREHVLVRTRADAGLVRDRRRRDAAIASGAHFVGTDFVDSKHAWLDLGPDAPARRNPVTFEGGRRRERVLEIEKPALARLSKR